MKQTAVEWLVNEIPVIDWTDPYWKVKFEQAKEMEKDQKENDLIDFAQWYSGMNIDKVINAYKRYQSEIYKQQEQ
jgi:hypothetical protein